MDAMSEDNDNHGYMAESEEGPRTIVIHKTHQGFGFNVRGQVSEGGQLKSIGGRLYAPMQYISAVLEGGPAEKAGLKLGDRILEVYVCLFAVAHVSIVIVLFLHSNGEATEGVDHQKVVGLIRSSGKQVTLVVVSVTEEEARRLEPESNAGSSGFEYYERRSVPVSIPQTDRKTDDNGKEYVVGLGV